MASVPADNEFKPRDNRDVVSELQARDLMEADFEAPPIDFLGPLMRRKSIVILFALIGSAVGYLLFRQELPTYQSSLRLMIWKKAPPTTMVGERIEQGVSLPKEQTLISSQEVIDSAIERGKLTELETFRNNPAPFYALKKMLTVKPVLTSTDTLELSCRGPIAEDLPGILSSVVDSYQRSLSDDRVNSAQDSIALIEKLHQQLVGDKEDAKSRYYFLMEKLNLSADADTAELKNPYLLKQAGLVQERDERKGLLSRVDELLNGLAVAFKVEGPAKKEVLQSLTIEAEKYLNMGYAHGGATSATTNTANRFGQIAKIENRIDSIKSSIETMDMEKKLMSRQLGDNHPSVVTKQMQLENARTLRDSLQGEWVKLQEEVASDTSKEKEEEVKSAQSLNTGINESSIRVYVVTLRREKDQHEQRIKALDEEIRNMEAQASIIRSEMAELNLLKNEIREKEKSVSDIMDRLSEFTVVASNFNTTRVRVIDLPQKGVVISPILRNYLLFSLLGGGLIGGLLAILIDRGDLAFRNPYEIFQKMKVPVICKIPTISKSKLKTDLGCTPTLITAIDPRSAASEAFRACRTALLFFGNSTGAKVYLLSSPSAGDGKSTAVANLAVSFAQGGKRVVVLDGDMRRPRQHKYFGISMKPGMIDFADGNATLDDIIRPTLQEDLSLVTCGGHTANPGEFVVSPKFKEILQGLRERFDIVLVDSPPLLPVADATALSTQVDGVLLVFRIRKGVVLASQKARELLDLVHARLFGIMVNGVDQNPYYNEYGGYGYPSQAGYYASKYYENQTKEYSEASDAS
jgi:capsular exopolysaccharide synthesis family protein